MAMFQPINFDLQAELQLAGAGPIKKYQTGPAAAVNSRHKTYSSKKGDLARSEVYNAVLKFLRYYTLDDALKAIKKQEVSDKFAEVPSEDDLDKGTVKKRNAQKLTKVLMAKCEDEDISKIVCRMSIFGIIKKTQLLTWVAYILGDPVEELQEDEDMDVRRLTAKAKTYVKDAIAQIGGEDVGYFVDYGKNDKFGFIIIREERTVNTRKQSKVVASSICFAYQSNPKFLFTHGDLNSQPIIKIVTRALGFNKYRPQSLIGKDLLKVAEACNRKVVKPDLENLLVAYDDKEKELNKAGIHHLDPSNEKMCKVMSALLYNPEEQPNPLKEFDFSMYCRLPKEVLDMNPEVKSSLVQTRIIIPKGVNADKYFAQLYEAGVIKDIEPFLKLKYKKANKLILKGREDD